jgi:hypothetical protein
MKIQNLKTKVIGPALLLIPMACMHIGDGHHDDGHHSGDRQCLDPQPSYQTLVYAYKVAPEIHHFLTKNGGFTLFTFQQKFNLKEQF